MDQKFAFLAGEGDHYFDRNAHKSVELEQNYALTALKTLGVSPRSVLEIGCSDGARLDQIRQTYAAECCGIDPSTKAIAYGRTKFPQLHLDEGTADGLEFSDGQFDVVLFGFCLYLCDLKDHFRIAFQADRVLKDGGLLIIYDFNTPLPYSNAYSHLTGIRSYKMDWSSMFTWSPSYRLLSRLYVEDRKPFTFDRDKQVSVDVMLKSVSLPTRL